MRDTRAVVLGLVCVAGISAVPTPAAAQEGRAKILRAAKFLDSTKRSRDILGYLHMGGTYLGYEVLSAHGVSDADDRTVPGHFALKVSYDWETAFGGNSTTAVYFFDDLGRVYDIKVSTTSTGNPPFIFAGATLNVLGNVLIAALGDQMTAQDRKEAQRLVDNADAKAFLIWSMNLQMQLGQ